MNLCSTEDEPANLISGGVFVCRFSDFVEES